MSDGEPNIGCGGEEWVSGVTLSPIVWSGRTPWKGCIWAQTWRKQCWDKAGQAVLGTAVLRCKQLTISSPKWDLTCNSGWFPLYKHTHHSWCYATNVMSLAVESARDTHNCPLWARSRGHELASAHHRGRRCPWCGPRAARRTMWLEWTKQGGEK